MSKEIAGFVGNSLRTVFAYGFFISAPQQHLEFLFASVEALVTSISQQQYGLETAVALSDLHHARLAQAESVSSFPRIIRAQDSLVGITIINLT
jgi:hypothetical protein